MTTAKIAIAATAFATALAFQPVSAANAGGFGLSFGVGDGDFQIELGDGDASFDFGDDDDDDDEYSCADARDELQDHFKRVWKVECGGNIYTFKAREYSGDVVIVKFNSENGHFWSS